MIQLFCISKRHKHKFKWSGRKGQKGEIMKYIVRYGMNAIESNSRNAKQHLRNLGGEYVRIEAKSGEFVCSATRWGDGSMTVCTSED